MQHIRTSSYSDNKLAGNTTSRHSENVRKPKTMLKYYTSAQRT